MKDKSSRHKSFLDSYNKVRKQLPPNEKIIRPKNEFRRERFDWRNEIDKLNKNNENNESEE
jgi:hypothetical protein